MMELTPAVLRRFTQIGIKQEITEFEQRLADLREMLATSVAADAVALPPIGEPTTPPAKRPKKTRKPWSLAARRAQSKRLLALHRRGKK